MITMSMGLFAVMLLIFFLSGGAIGWLLRGLKKCECESVGSTDIQEAIRDVIRKDLSRRKERPHD